MSSFDTQSEAVSVPACVLPETITIQAFDPAKDALAFRTLNEEWIVRHFTLEQKDLETLRDPVSNILEKGGFIFMLYIRGEAAGCAALLALGNGVYELSKMSIAPSLRGQGLGRRLLLHTIEAARRLGASSLFLGSSLKLANAVHLYESVGFQHVGRETLPPMPYVRADVFMSMVL